MCGFDIYVSGFVPVCTVRSICRWFDCDLCKLDSFAFGSIYFLWRLICFLADRFIFAQFDLYLGKLDLFARVSIYFCAVRLTFHGFDFMLTTFVLFLTV